jgi:hypothetical protein
MEELPPSRRLVDQRVRNRIMEAVLGLAEGDAGVDAAGATEWFEMFFDFFPYDGQPVRDVSTVDDEEWDALMPLLRAMQSACHETPRHMSDAELKASGWPNRIAPIAAAALKTLLARGRFSEDAEEAASSSPTAWP